MKKTINKSN